MYCSDRSHKFNQSTLPAEDTAMAQGAEQGSLDVTVTSSQARQDGRAAAERQATGVTQLLSRQPWLQLVLGHSFATEQQQRLETGKGDANSFSLCGRTRLKKHKEIHLETLERIRSQPFRRARVDAKHGLLDKGSFRFHLFLRLDRPTSFMDIKISHS